MDTLWTFGCSYTEGYIGVDSPTYKEYQKYCGGEFPKCWPEILSDKLGFNLINKGEGASGNDQIFQEVCKNAHLFQHSDIIIIGWSFLERYRMANDDSTWIKFGPGKIRDDLPISQSCHDAIILNRTLKPYTEEIYNYENIIDRLCNSLSINVYYWTIINELIYNQPKEKLNNKKYLLFDHIKDKYDNTFSVVKKHGGLNIYSETNRTINDSHMGKTGHLVQAELFHQHILEHNRKWTSL